MLTPDEVRDTSFSSPPIGRRGYDMAEVDAFLDRLEATLRGTDAVTADEVRDVVFRKPPIGKRGYNEDEVDAFLDVAQAHLAGHAAPARPTTPPTTPQPRPDDTPPGMVAPKRRWWRR